MLAELGQFVLLIALTVAVAQGVLPLWGTLIQKISWIQACTNLARTQCLFLAIALSFLAVLFYQNDFSVAYVAQNSNSALPTRYRLSAVWGGHEGSLLLWVFMLSLWTTMITIFGQHMPVFMRARIIGVLGLVSTGFLLFMIFSSNPFSRLIPAVAEGKDLNPLLQDPGLIFHPPMLYMGYVGFSVTFAFAIAALMTGRMDSAWARWVRPWALAAWCFLTLGIALGSWWAYYELGWGGWWFWDPVENASFMPWIVGTALLHSLAVTEARGIFKPWTALLAILTFSLCLLGAFLVRSGVLTSVHSFATDPQRGLFILILLFIAVTSSLFLYAWRAQSLNAIGRFSVISRESGILLNNIFLTIAAISVLLGTLYPLILDAFAIGKISVGPPYFDSVFGLLAGTSTAFLAIGSICRWKNDTVIRLLGQLILPFICAIVAAVLVPLMFTKTYHIGTTLGLILAFWILFSTARSAYARMHTRTRASGGFWGMIIAHTGIGIFIIGVTIVNTYDMQRDVLLQEGKREALGKYDFELMTIKKDRGDNYDTIIGAIRVWENDNVLAILHPEKRRYFAQPQNPMTEAGIAVGWHGDWYASLGDPLKNGAWSARLQYKPFIRLIWGGAVLMALGGAIAGLDRRYRRKQQAI